MMPRLLPSELAAWSGGQWSGGEPPFVGGVSNDSRKIQKGDIYFALKGMNFDGHDFIDEVFSKGAAAAVVSTDWSGKACIGRSCLRVKDPAAALRSIASGYRDKVNPQVIAVTGSAGKSTVKEMIAQVLAREFDVAATRGNWNNDIGLPLSMLAMEESAKVGVFEVGMNHPGEIRGLCGILKPTWGVITNVGPVHIEFFDSIEGIANEKADLLRSLPADGISLLNRDANCFEVLKKAAPGESVTISMHGSADYVCKSWHAGRGEAVIHESRSNEAYPFKMKLRGEHNVMNLMFAVAVARRKGMTWQAIAQGILAYAPLPMRWEESLVRGVRVINDAYNANPMSMRAATAAFAQERVEGRKWLVLAGMLELGRETDREHLELGSHVAGLAGVKLVVVGKLGMLIAEGAVRAGIRKEDILRCSSNADAAERLKEVLRSGDAVLLKASRGMKLEEIVQVLKQGG